MWKFVQSLIFQKCHFSEKKNKKILCRTWKKKNIIKKCFESAVKFTKFLLFKTEFFDFFLITIPHPPFASSIVSSFLPKIIYYLYFGRATRGSIRGIRVVETRASLIHIEINDWFFNESTMTRARFFCQSVTHFLVFLTLKFWHEVLNQFYIFYCFCSPLYWRGTKLIFNKLWYW